MVVGNGLVGKAFNRFQDNNDLLFFCSGVSNSTCREQSEFNRERNLLLSHINDHPEKTLIYFSTCSIEDPTMAGSMYRQHKLEMEELIAASCKSYYVFRLSNVVGYTSNPVTILNFLYNSIRSGHTFDLWRNSARNLIDVEDVVSIITQFLSRKGLNNSILNVANPVSYNVVRIVGEIERFLGKKGNYNLVDKGMPFEIPLSSDMQDIIMELNIDFGPAYLPSLLEKYYER
jgi:nucleoside-diphosphate-sugar epimerase